MSGQDLYSSLSVYHSTMLCLFEVKVVHVVAEVERGRSAVLGVGRVEVEGSSQLPLSFPYTYSFDDIAKFGILLFGALNIVAALEGTCDRGDGAGLKYWARVVVSTPTPKLQLPVHAGTT